LQQSKHLWHQLAMFFRDELLSWSWRRPLGLNLGPAASGSSMNPADFKHKVTTNVDNVINRITGIAPQFLSEEVTSISDIPSNVMSQLHILVVMNSRDTGPDIFW
jgi:transformation/transcription domain-associated protein